MLVCIQPVHAAALPTSTEMPVTNPENSGSIVRRAELRKKQIIDAISEFAKSDRPLVSDSKASPQPPGNILMEATFNSEIDRKDATEIENKENISLQKSNFKMYPVKPPRSVYNSPLISKNREPIWKSPTIPYPAPYSHPTSSKQETISVPNTYTYYYHSPQSCGKDTAVMLSGKDMEFSKLYPSLPRSDVGNCLKQVLEEKDPKDDQTASPITADLDESIESPSQILIKKENSPLASSTFIESAESPSESLLYTTCEGDILNDKNAESAHLSLSEDDIEDTFEMDRFLEDALGSLSKSSSPGEEPSCETVEDSTFTLCCYRNLAKSVGSSSSSVLSSEATRCATLPRFVNECLDLNSRAEMLLKEADRQQQLMMQASKALWVCRSTKAGSIHLVDAERVLLIASLRHEAALKEIQVSHLEADFESRGDLKVMDIVAPLRPEYLTTIKPAMHDDQWFVCVISCGEQVVATKAVICNFQTESLKFPGVLEVTNLPSSFSASVQIYMLRVCVPQESSKRKSIRSVRKLLQIRKKSCSKAAGGLDRIHTRTPAFSLSGSALFTLSDIDQLQTNTIHLNKMPLMSPLKGVILMNVKAALRNPREMTGFLDVLEERVGCRAWQRKWCLLSRLTLKFWNYPTDQDLKDPEQVIELRACISVEVPLAPRNLCARPRTIMLETKRPPSEQDINSTILDCNHGYTVERHFLSCDSVVVLNEWTQAINESLSAIQTWKLPHV